MINRLEPDEWQDIVDSIVSIWPRSRWSTPKPTGDETVISRAQVLYEHFSGIPAAAIRRALNEWLDVGRGKAPKVDELRARALKLASRPEIPADADPNDPAWCDHSWGIIEDEAGYRTGKCRRCGTERTFLARQLLTDAERAEHQKASEVEPSDEHDEDQVEVWV